MSSDLCLCIFITWKWKMFYLCCGLKCQRTNNSSTLQDEYILYILLLFLSVIKQFQNTGVWPQSSGSVILISCLFSSSSFVIGSLEINLSWSVWGYVIVGSYLVERGNGSWGVAAEAVAPLDCGDDALEVSAVQQLGKLQEAVAQDKQLRKTDKQLKMLWAFYSETEILVCEGNTL